MTVPNRVRDIDPAKFTILGFRDDCGWNAPVRVTDKDMAGPALIEQLPRRWHSFRECSIRII